MKISFIRSMGHTAVAALLMVASEFSCAPRSCTEAACHTGVFVTLTPSQSDWLPGDYQFVVDADGAVTTCEGSLGATPCKGQLYLPCTPANFNVLVEDAGCSLPTRRRAFSMISVRGAAFKQVAITVRRDGLELVRQTLIPSYLTFEPNGHECGPTCLQGPVTLAVPGAIP